MSTYGYTKQINRSFDEAVEAIKEASKEQSFGILCEIDVQKAMKEKAGKEVEPYVILGACNPGYAYQALQMEKEIGLLLPCNIIVYESEGIVYASSVNPHTLLGVTGNEELSEIAGEVKKSLEQIVDTAAGA